MTIFSGTNARKPKREKYNVAVWETIFFKHSPKWRVD